MVMLFFSKEGSFFVYCHTVPNGKVYIGQTRQNPYTRWHNGSGYRQNPYFTNAIKKYGWENIKHEILEYDLSQEEANAIEKEYISRYRSNDRRYGYNITDGGEAGFYVPEETREKLRKINTGRKRPHSEEHNLHGSQAKGHPVKQFTLDDVFIRQFHSTGEAAYQLGKSRTRQSHIVSCCHGKRRQAFGYRWCWAEDDKPPVPLKYEPVQRRRVAQYHLNGQYIAQYESLKTAGLAIGQGERSGDNIQFCCSGRTKMAYGYQWRYIDDEPAGEIEPIAGHPVYAEVKEYLKNHTHIETAYHFDLKPNTLRRYLKKAEQRGLSDDQCLY